MTSVSNDPYGSAPAPSGAGSSGGSGDGSGRADVAKQEGAHVKDEATGAVRDVAGTAKEQAGNVAGDVRDQARRLTEQTQGQLHDQARTQRDRAVNNLRSVSGDLHSMADKADEAEETGSGLGAKVSRQGAQYAGQLADYLDGREPGELLDDVRSFARRRPGAFLLGAAVAGVLAGRLSRSVIDIRRQDDSGSSNGSSNGAYGAYDAPSGARTYPAGGYQTDGPVSQSYSSEPGGYPAQTNPAGFAEPYPAEPGYPAGQAYPADQGQGYSAGQGQGYPAEPGFPTDPADDPTGQSGTTGGYPTQGGR